MKTLIDAVLEKQGRTTDEEFAALFPMHRVTWTNKRRKKQPLSPADRERILQLFPDLKDIFLSEITNNSSNKE